MRKNERGEQRKRVHCYLEQIIHTLIGVCLDQINHSLGKVSACMQRVSMGVDVLEA